MLMIRILIDLAGIPGMISQKGDGASLSITNPRVIGSIKNFILNKLIS
jgi:hypothetical protein